MRRKRLLSVMLLLAIIQAGLVPSPVRGHVWLDYCSGGYQLLNVFQHQSQGGVDDWTCGDDVHWGDSYGSIRGFNDLMTSYHIRDRNGDGEYSCNTFWEHESYKGHYISATFNAQAGGAHYDEDNIGANWNDRVSSSFTFGYDSSRVCPEG